MRDGQIRVLCVQVKSATMFLNLLTEIGATEDDLPPEARGVLASAIIAAETLGNMTVLQLMNLEVVSLRHDVISTINERRNALHKLNRRKANQQPE